MSASKLDYAQTKMDLREEDTALLLLSNYMPESSWNLNSGIDPVFLGNDFNFASVLEAPWTCEMCMYVYVLLHWM